MTTTRRDFLRVSLVSGAAMLVGIRGVDAAAPAAAAWKPNLWVRIDPAGDVVIIIGKQEMGQGVRTSLAMIVAEELDLAWDAVKIEQASTGAGYTGLNTGGSGSIESGWRNLRPAAATVRAMLVSAAAHEWKVDPAELQTEHGHVIGKGRRASYGSLAAAAAKLPVPADVQPKSVQNLRLVGTAVQRIDGRAIVTGTAKYGLDTRVPNMLFAAISRGGKVQSFDATAAKKVRGVREVVEVPSGVAVVADSTWGALKGVSLLKVQRLDPPAFDSVQYIDSLLSARGDGHVSREAGDARAAIAGAATKVSAQYVYPFYAHAPVEPMNAIAAVSNGRCEIWAPTQAPNRVQRDAAAHLGIAVENVVVHPTLIGGGFGRRLGSDYAIDAVDVSRAIGGAPAQVVWSRSDDMKYGHLQHASVESMEAGLDAQGNVIGWSHTKVSNPIMSIFPPPATDDPDTWDASGQVDIPYAIPAIRTAYLPVSSPVKYGPWRSVESPSTVFGRECFIDELAHAAGRDPIQFRIDLLGGSGVTKAGSRQIERDRLRRMLEIVRDASKWGSVKGAGVACNIYDGETYVAYVVHVTVNGDQWHVDRVFCALDCGVVINPTGVRQQIEGGIVWALTQLMSEVTIQKGEVQQQSYADFAVPRISDVPEMDIQIVKSDRGKPYGMGEPPVPPFAPAVLNAIFAATGKRIRRLPLTAVVSG